MNGETLGIPREFVPLDLNQFGFKNMPANATAAYLRGFELIGMKPKQQPPLRRHMKSAQSATPKGSTVPAATATKSEPKPAAKGYIVKTPNLAFGNLKAFSSPEAAYRAGMSLQAGIGRRFNTRNATAEQFLRERGMSIFNIASTADPVKGGYLAPEELSQAIIVNMSRTGAARQLATYVPMAGSNVRVPVELSGPTVNYVTEMGQITGTDATWGEVSLEPAKRATLGYISAELNGDALVAYTDTLVDATARAHARAEDREFVLADGTSAYGGAVGLLAALKAGGTVTATGADDWAELTMAHFGALVAKLPEQYADGSESFICSSAFYALGMLRAAGGAAQGFAADGTPMFMGKKVHLLPAMPSTSAASQVSCLYGNWRESAVFGDRGLAFALSDQCPEAFSKDLIAVRCVNRAGVTVRNGGTASAAGSFVGLATAAS